MEFTAAEKQAIEKLRTRYPEPRSLVLPLLWMIQKREGYIPEEAVSLIAEELQIPPIWVEEPRTWYSMFNTQKKGKYIIEVCQNATCSVLGSEEIIDHICERLQIKVGETTADGMFTLQVAECLGSCGTGPVMQIDDICYDLLTPEKVDQILDDLRHGKVHEQQPLSFPEYQ